MCLQNGNKGINDDVKKLSEICILLLKPFLETYRFVEGYNVLYIEVLSSTNSLLTLNWVLYVNTYISACQQVTSLLTGSKKSA